MTEVRIYNFKCQAFNCEDLMKVYLIKQSETPLGEPAQTQESTRKTWAVRFNCSRFSSHSNFQRKRSKVKKSEGGRGRGR